MPATAIRQCPGWWPNLVQAECDDCGWVGPTRDVHQTTDAFLVRLEKADHECRTSR